MRFVWPVLTFLGLCVAAVVMGVQYVGAMVIVFPAVVFWYAAFALGRSYLMTIGAIGAGLTLAWPWMAMLFRGMPDLMHGMLELSFEASKTPPEQQLVNGLPMEPTYRLGSACLSGVGLGILVLVAGLLLSATFGADAARRRMILRAAAITLLLIGGASLFSPSTSFGFGLLVAAVPGALMIWKSDADTRATLRELRDTW